MSDHKEEWICPLCHTKLVQQPKTAWTNAKIACPNASCDWKGPKVSMDTLRLRTRSR